MAQDIELSPRKILSYMRDLEEKLPKRKYCEFDSNIISKITNNDDLNIAARKMMDFVGLKQYEPQCSFCKTDENVGGFTTVQRNDNIVPISVSEQYKDNKTVILAILAHEICHKVIYINGIYYNGIFEFMNEVFTDICTIYVGFGNLILSGYISSNGKYTSYLGYLKFHVYKDSYDIVRQILSDTVPKENIGNDYFLEEAFQKWHSSADKRELFMSLFVDIQDEYSKLIRDFMLLEQMTHQIKEWYNPTLDKADEYFFRKGEFFDKESQELIKPIGAFSAIYENILTQSRQELLQDYDDTITSAMLALISTGQNIDTNKLRYNAFRCPFCAKEAVNDKYVNRKLIVKCPSCHKHFHINLETWNYTAELGRLKRKEKEQQDQLVAKGKAEGEKIGFQKGLEKSNQNHISAYLDTLPKWLRWLIKHFSK